MLGPVLADSQAAGCIARPDGDQSYAPEPYARSPEVRQFLVAWPAQTLMRHSERRHCARDRGYQSPVTPLWAPIAGIRHDRCRCDSYE